MIDIHCHLLPALDDGPATVEASLNMCRIACLDGIRKIVATPHINEKFTPSLTDIESGIAQIMKEAGGDIEVLPGSDVLLSPFTKELIGKEKVVPLNIKNYLLIELPDTFSGEVMERELLSVQQKGFRVIVTHPERQEIFSYRMDFLENLVKKGCLVQVTSSSITGKFGRKVQGLTRTLFRKGLVHVIATDAHSDRYRKPKLSEAVDTAKRWIGKDAELMVTSIPEKIIKGESIEI